MRPALQVEGLRVVRGEGRRQRTVLDDVALTVASGEVVLLEGPSGSGKTTLMLVAAGLLTPHAGRVAVAGHPLSDPSQRRSLRATHIGFVFQRANLLDRLSVWENVALAGALAGCPAPAIGPEVDRLLDALGIADLAHRSPAELSGGEEHRVAVARALVHRPALVLADEPTGNLDAVSGRAVAATLCALARERGAGVLIATHDARLQPWADRRVALVDGVLHPLSGSLV